MATFNSVQFIGRLGKDPDFNLTSNGKPVAKFSIAVDQGKDSQGKDKETMWLNIVVWDKLAEFVEKYAYKGMQVLVAGRLQMQKYVDKSGVNRQAIDILASTVQLLEKKSETPTRPHVPSDDFDPFGDDPE